MMSATTRTIISTVLGVLAYFFSGSILLGLIVGFSVGMLIIKMRM